jgi:hypothetical protein
MRKAASTRMLASSLAQRMSRLPLHSNAMSEQALTSLAILTVNWDRGHDTIDSFVPLIAECLRQDGDKPVSAVELQRVVKSEFGLTIPLGALQVIVARCQKRGLVRRENNVYVPVRKKLDKVEFAPNRADALRKHRALLQKLCEFANERYDLDWSEEDADAALLAYLQESSLPVLAAATDGDPLPRPAKPSRRTRHVMSAFAGHLYDADPEGFTCLETVVKGHLLSAVLFYPDLGQVQSRFEDLDVYCDTPFLLPAIGYSEEGLTLQCVELIELLRDLGANLKCFHHTEEEVAGVLEAEAAKMRGSIVEPTTDYYTSRAFPLNEIEELLIKLPDAIRNLGLETVDTPTWTEQPDEIALDEAIEKQIHYTREKAREKDVKSLAAVFRLRSGRRMGRFESAKAIFLTTNTTLARASSSFFRDVEGPGGIPICLPVALMTRLAWVKKPMAAPDLPRHMVIASSYAALNPSDKLWRGYLDEISRRREKGDITDDEYHLLRSSREARQALMDETFGDEEAFTAGTLDEVLAHAKEQIQAEAKAETDAERAERLAAQEEARSSRALVENLDRVHREEVEKHARIAGAIVGWGLALLLAAAVIVGLVATIPGVPLLEVTPLTWRIIIWICVAAFVGISLFAVVVRHIPVFGIRRAVSARVERRWCERGYHRLDELQTRASGTSS